MNIPQRIASYSTSAETNIRSNEFLQIGRALLATRSPREAEQFLARVPASERTREAFQQRAAVPAGTTYDSAWGGALSTYSQLSDAFAATVNSAFDRVLNDGAFFRVPPMTRIAVATAGAVAFTVNESAPKPATQLTMVAIELAMAKVVAYVETTAELMRASSAGVLDFLGRSLRQGVSVYTDQYLNAQLVVGLTAIPSSGSGSEAVRTDLRYLMDAVTFGADARLYYLAPTTIAKRLAVVGDTTGGKMFVGSMPTGGVLDGIPLLVSDAATAGTLTLFDASQIAVASGQIELDRSDQATIMTDTAPDSPPTASSNMQSAWQRNTSFLRAERYLSVQRMKTGAVAQVSGMTGIGDSPN